MRRGLWAGPPRYLGVDGGERWDRQALDELTTDCYIFLLNRLRALKQHLRVKENIDGLIRLNIRHFLHERQKRCDLLGFRIFQILRTAARRSVARGALIVAEGGESIDNGTLLAGVRLADPADRSEMVIELSAVAAAWSDELMPDLLLARGQRKERLIERLCELLEELGEEGGRVFTFKEILDACKHSIRARWQAMWRQERGQVAHEAGGQDLQELVRVVPPSARYEEWESYESLIACVDEALEQIEAEGPTDGHLHVLWQFLRIRAPDPEMEVLPSRRKIAETLGIPRYLLPELYARLGQLVSQCHIDLSSMDGGKDSHKGPARASSGEVR